MSRFLLGSAIAALTLPLALPAMAQTVDDEFVESNAIIVTATKREQTLQEVPVAVTVTPAEVIERAQILDIKDLQSVVPTLRVTQNQNSQQTDFAIRGFGNGGNNIGIEPAVGIFIDGVYRSRAAAQIGDLPKLERVEVLRGPQSTLFGKNSSAGVISIVTAEPSFEQTGYVEAGISNFDGRLFRGYISGPVTENVAMSIGGSVQSRDGYADAFLDGLDAANDRQRFNLRGQLLFEGSDDFSLRVIADYSELDELCCYVTNLINGPTAGVIEALGGQLADPEDPFDYTYFSDREPQNEIEDYGVSFHANAQLTDDLELVSISAYRRNDAFYDSDVDYTTLNLIPSVAVESEINTFTQELRFQGAKDRFSYLVGGYAFFEEIDGSSQLINGTDLRNYLGFLTGVALGADPATALSTGLSTFDGIAQANGLPAGSFFAPTLSSREVYGQDNFAYSIFGNLDFDVTDRLTATVGISYVNDDKDVTFAQVENNVAFSQLNFADEGAFNTLFAGALSDAFADTFGIPFTPANIATVTSTPQGAAGFGALQSAVAAGVGALDLTDPAQNPLLALTALQFTQALVDFPNAVESGETSDDDVTYTLRLAYDVNDDLNVYGAYSTGFKATSFNLSRDSRPFSGDIDALAAAGLLPDVTAVTLGTYAGTRFAGPEESEVFEVGVKGAYDWGNFALTVFQQTIDDFQSNVFVGNGFVLNNAGEQRTRGIEFESILRPVDGLTLNLAATYLDAQFEDFVGGPTVGGAADLTGDDVDGVHPFSGVIGAQYDFTLGETMDAYVRADYLYESEVDTNTNVPGEDGANAIPGLEAITREVSTFNAAAGLGFGNGLSVSVWGRNIFDDEYIQTAFPGVIQAGTFNGYPNQPATYGVNLRYDF